MAKKSKTSMEEAFRKANDKKRAEAAKRERERTNKARKELASKNRSKKKKR